MGDALSLGELRAIVFAVCTLSFFAALVGWMPSSFQSGIADREKVVVPSEPFHGLSMIKYSAFDEFNLTVVGDYTNNTGGHDWEMDWELQGGTDCITIWWLYIHATYVEDVFSLRWYDHDGNDVSLTGGGTWYCNDRLTGDGTTWINSGVIDAEYDPATKLSAFTVSYGPVKFDIFFGFSGVYAAPSEAWIAGDLQVLLAVLPSNTATQQGGISMIFGMLTFQQITGVPDSMAYLFGAFMWILITVIVMALISRFIPFL